MLGWLLNLGFAGGGLVLQTPVPADQRYQPEEQAAYEPEPQDDYEPAAEDAYEPAAG